MQKILFIDRDGTLVEEPSDFQVDALSKISLMPYVIPSLLALIQTGYRLVMVSNQDGLGTEQFPAADFHICQDWILSLFASQGIKFSDVFICPHRPDDVCRCRKPNTGLLDNLIHNTAFDRVNSWVIGDRASDDQLAANLGVGFLAINASQGWQQISQRLLKPSRYARLKRDTAETSIDITVDLNQASRSQINTPIPFFSHMLEQVAQHGGFYLQLNAQGDTQVDDHHLIEDCALALGQVLKQALGDKWGIGRYGFTLPMDESLAQLALDLSGRPYCNFQSQFTRESVGGMATEMVAHFFNSLAQALAASIHISVTGENHHHMIEACFKALGKALAQAFQQKTTILPSTKGVL